MLTLVRSRGSKSIHQIKSRRRENTESGKNSKCKSKCRWQKLIGATNKENESRVAIWRRIRIGIYYWGDPSWWTTKTMNQIVVTKRQLWTCGGLSIRSTSHWTWRYRSTLFDVFRTNQLIPDRQTGLGLNNTQPVQDRQFTREARLFLHIFFFHDHRSPPIIQLIEPL